ncbi:hypothetical protein SAMN05421812_11281 [Asanoa hainanensis]|uniref:Uncharacterized protein n=1 Tax=Asanoa hainanensis TaxID=560556 RepID=A0A239P186_9ACTN|nr:hypothetical protein [Asanoa hainanensis]SNT60384.1 hypothetical protein SAMN05421812_11281 [Asanoa hainanensis]
MTTAREKRRVGVWLWPLLTAVGMLAAAAGLCVFGVWMVLPTDDYDGAIGLLNPFFLGSFLLAGLLVLFTGHVTLLVYETFADR